ncbi:plasmid recombination enzyme [Larkinella arboricola]|uniref:Plasmid recombination enzyme n=1 Tax=Larkinella arboricola TaxID=643671 RepID=A0A327WDK2_LARAB|nr:MobV family relaxase [Larkinella arboricola]RAJ89099.1 plasmid recombination enzyme [Larkinella arboricola]
MKAICRVAKIKGNGSITGKSEHNYRQGHVPNADKERQHLNKEYVLNYENLGKAIQARIEHAGIQKVRQDAVKGMEFILTASPELFKRDPNGQVVGDYRNSDWVKANLEFMKQHYGRNLVAFTLHQDEKTPHIHAIVVPITADNRLCAKELFTPRTLRQLQTDYAEAMKPFKLERGIENSRAKHVEMKHIYGLQQQERKAIEQELAPIQQAHQPLQIQSPGILDLLNLERWKQEQEAKINAEYSRRLAEVQKAAQKAQNAAIANATAKEQGKALQKRLSTSEGLKQANYEKGQKTQQQLKNATMILDRVAILLDEKRLSPQWSQEHAGRVRSRVLPQLEKDITESLEGIRDPVEALRRLESKGYQIDISKNEEQFFVKDPKTEVRLDFIEGRIDGRLIADLVNESIDQTLKKDQEQAQKAKLQEEQKLEENPKRSRSLGLGR